MPTLHLMVGLPCSGKTTLARRLETERHALRLTPDEWHVQLFGQDVTEPGHDERHAQIESLLWGVAARALALGVNVILDFGFWARVEREEYRERAKALGAASEIHWCDAPPGELLDRLAARNAQASGAVFTIPADRLAGWIALFERPDAAELARRA